MTPFSQLTAEDFQHAVLSLLPRGRAWPRKATTLLAALAGAIGDCLWDFRQQVVNFLDVESDPAQAIQLLPDWEADYGLPDSCSPASPTLQQRHNALLAKIAASPGGQSAAYYINVAQQLGYTITITTWKTSGMGAGCTLGSPMCTTAWRFVWRVNAPSITLQRFQLGGSVLGDPFWTLSDTELECRLQKIQPGYGLLWFQYG